MASMPARSYGQFCGVARALELPADMVLLDLLMPEKDGFSFLRERQVHPHLSRVPVVVLSAAGMDSLREASQLRATAVLSKPLDLDVHMLGVGTCQRFIGDGDAI